jgi:hypothetical protein
MTASAPNEDIPIVSAPHEQNISAHTEANPDPVREPNQDVLASSQRRRYLDSLDNSELAT